MKLALSKDGRGPRVVAMALRCVFKFGRLGEIPSRVVCTSTWPQRSLDFGAATTRVCG